MKVDSHLYSWNCLIVINAMRADVDNSILAAWTILLHTMGCCQNACRGYDNSTTSMQSDLIFNANDPREATFFGINTSLHTSTTSAYQLVISVHLLE